MIILIQPILNFNINAQTIASKRPTNSAEISSPTNSFATNSRICVDPCFSPGGALLVIGQTDFTSRVIGSSASGLFLPSQLTFDSSGNLWVADSANSRVLGYTPPFTNGMAASIVLGQPDSNSCNDPLFGPMPNANTLCGPIGLTFDSSGNLWVADSGSSRIVKYTPPFSTGMAASQVLGQPNFGSADANNGTANSLDFPIGLTFDSSGNLWAADSGNERILEYTPPFTNGMAASIVLGHPNFTNPFVVFCGPPHNPPIANSIPTTANSLCFPAGPSQLTFDSSGNLWVADSDNNRILEYTPPFTNGMAASQVLGQPDFMSAAANRGSSTPTANSLESPAGLTFDSSGNLWVADSDNNRILEYTPPFTNGMAASQVLGQPDFMSASCPPQPTISSYCGSSFLKFDSSGNLWVVDSGNERILKLSERMP